MTKQKMVTMIAGVLVSYENWSTADITNVWLASSNRDLAELPSLAFGLELASELPLHLLFPAGGVQPPVMNGVVTNEPAVVDLDQSTQAQLVAADQLSQVLALLQGQKVAMSAMETYLHNL